MLKLFFLYLSEPMAVFMISYIEIPEQASLSLLIFFHSSPSTMSLCLDSLKTSMSIFFFYKIFSIPDSVCHFCTIRQAAPCIEITLSYYQILIIRSQISGHLRNDLTSPWSNIRKKILQSEFLGNHSEFLDILEMVKLSIKYLDLQCHFQCCKAWQQKIKAKFSITLAKLSSPFFSLSLCCLKTKPKSQTYLLRCHTSDLTYPRPLRSYYISQ